MMERMPLNRRSIKQSAELRLRTKIKLALIEEHGYKCMTCGSNGDWRGLSLSHIIPLSECGETSTKNCLIECGFCHDRYEKHPERRPLWQIQGLDLTYKK